MGITREQVIKQFLRYVEYAEKAPYIRKPFSWAAYQTWKWVNGKEKNRNEVDNDQSRTYEFGREKGSNYF